MPFRWQDNHMPLFLETYQRYECLWNHKCSEYSKSNAREKAYSLMVADLNIPGLTVADIKCKIKTIRTRYGAELNKIRNSERNLNCDDDVYEPRLFWFKDADAFLRRVATSKPSSSNLKESGSNNSRGNDASASIATNARQHSKHLEQPTADVEDNDASSLEYNENAPNIGANCQNCKKARKRSVSTSIPEIRDAIQQIIQISDNNKEPQNEFDVFCESLAIQLKNMPLDRALICQEKLQNVMTQERLSQITQTVTLLPMSSSSSTYQ